MPSRDFGVNSFLQYCRNQVHFLVLKQIQVQNLIKLVLFFFSNFFELLMAGSPHFVSCPYQS